jgi:hypothetical protein
MNRPSTVAQPARHGQATGPNRPSTVAQPARHGQATGPNRPIWPEAGR